MGILHVFNTNDIRFHLLQLRREGLSAIRRKSRVVYYILAPFFVITALLVIIFRRLFFFRFIPISSDPIGHISTETEMNHIVFENTIRILKKRYRFTSCKFIPIFYITGGVCNKTIYKLLRKKYIFINPIAGKIICKCLKALKMYSHAPKIPIRNRDMKFERSELDNPLKITRRMNIKFMKFMSKTNITLTTPYVCILNRESTYHESMAPSKKSIDDHNKYRNVGIMDFLPLVTKLNQSNIQVIRMGSNMKEVFYYENPLYFDYAKSERKSEFLDILISANCEFFVSVSSGLDMIAHQFRKPVYYLNVAPLSHVFVMNKTIFTPKLLYSNEEKNFLHIKSKQFQKAKFILRTQELDNMGLVYKNNTPDEIENFANEVILFHNNKLRLSGKQIKLQEIFWKSFPFSTELHFRQNHNAIFSPYFLNKHKDLFT